MFPAGTHIYFLGIGGIGMSALARYYRWLGYPVSGFDRTRTDLTDQLAAEGIPVFYEQRLDQLAGVGAIIRTPAVKDGDVFSRLPELTIPVLKRAEALGQISAARRTIAVAGTHGKTTTTSLVSHLLVAGGLDPTCFVGGIAANLAPKQDDRQGSNFRFGAGPWLVAEADEFDRSFLQLSPEIAILTSIDPDHLDIYGSSAGVEQSYRDFLHRVRPGGHAFLHQSLRPWAESGPLPPGVAVHYYGESADLPYRYSDVRPGGLSTQFTLTLAGASAPATLRLPGAHNLANATAAAAAAHAAGLPLATLASALAGFRGVKRRFEVYLDGPRLSYVDDYAHHPTEIDALIAAARSAYPDRRLWVVFQPHLFSRTRDFFTGFVASLDRADRVLINPIYPAREAPLPGITSDALLAQLRVPASLVPLADTPTVLADLLQTELPRAPILVLTVGAGDIDTLCRPIAQRLTPLL